MMKRARCLPADNKDSDDADLSRSLGIQIIMLYLSCCCSFKK